MLANDERNCDDDEGPEVRSGRDSKNEKDEEPRKENRVFQE